MANTPKKTSKSDVEVEVEVEETTPDAYQAPEGEGNPPFTPDRPDLGPEPQK